ncbi:hypothetical protein B1C78_09710 [Thioalkalivibrio denitrificans]|uniref:Uncharacterized protein n=1 Tax=Thioalkalivibrio denitrificans TaxID=108003 RepID=A0A1V3NFX6_9GAMM|nr:hypothetical protein [Thioalkalivibrio denitrificans]OOG23981.1 hypothetical protein B1C78_09710 [Thioalkalivibrio denitrificans]
MRFFLRRRQGPKWLRQQFLDRFMGRTLIVHRGLPPEWLDELLKQPGGGGHFRIDARRVDQKHPTPIEWFVRDHVLPLALPMPVLVQVGQGFILLRHLTRNEQPVHPGEIRWFLDEMDTRHHMRLRITHDEFVPEPGIPSADNEARSMTEHRGL